MPFSSIDPRNIAPQEAVPVVTTGGLDLLSNAVQLNPGSLQECMNYEVGLRPGYKQADGLFGYSGRSTYLPKEMYCATPAASSILYAGGLDSEAATAITYNAAGGESVFSNENLTLTNTGFGANGDFPNTKLVDNKAYRFYYSGGELKAELWDFSNNTVQELTGAGDQLSYFDDEIYRVCSITPVTGQPAYVYGEAFGGPTLTVYDPTGTPAWDDYAVGSGSIGDGITPQDYLVSSDTALYAWFITTGGDYRVMKWESDAVNSTTEATFTGVMSTDFDATDTSISPASEEGKFWIKGSSGQVFLFNLSTNSVEATLPSTAYEGTHLLSATAGVYKGARLLALISADLDVVGNINCYINVVNVTNPATPVNEYIRSELYENVIPKAFFSPDAVLFAYTRMQAEVEQLDIREITGDLGEMSEAGYYTATGNSRNLVGIKSITGPTLEPGALYNAKTVSGTFADPSIPEIAQIKYLGDLDGAALYTIVRDAVPSLRDADEFYLESLDSAGSYSLQFSGTSLCEFADVEEYSNTLEQIGESLSSGNAVPGDGPITALFTHKGKLYVGRDDGGVTKLYVAPSLVGITAAPVWEQVDLGHEIAFNSGESDPITYYDRVYLEEAIEAPDPDLSVLPTESANVAFPVVANGNNFVWNSTFNATDGSTTTSSITRVQTVVGGFTDWMSTQTLRLTGFELGFGRPTINKSRVVGIRAQVNWEASENGSQSRMSNITLLNVEGSDNKATLAVQTPTASPVSLTETVGGTTDLWGATNPSIERVLDSNFGIDLRFEGRRNTGVPGNARMAVRWVKLSVYYETGEESIYIWDGASDVAEGEMINAFVKDGSYDEDDAEGIYSIHNLTNPGSVSVGDEIRTAAAGSGELLGIVDAVPVETTLPGFAAIKAEDALVKTIEANFYIDEDRRAIYGVTGAGPAFTFDGDRFRYIRVAIPEDKDKPRDIYDHESHLALAYNSGSVLLSVIGEPLNFSGRDGASEWGFGDVITGLMPLSGSAMGVTTKKTIQSLVGNTINNITRQDISSNVGALEYTHANMGQTIYCDANGVANINSSANYGDFVWGRLSQLVSPWIIPTLNEQGNTTGRLVGSLSSRAKSQYRMFFEDGTLLTMSLQGVDQPTPMFTFQNFDWTVAKDGQYNNKYTPTALFSGVQDNGTEITVIGTAEGKVFILDQLPGVFDSGTYIPYDCRITFNPFNANLAHLNFKYNEIIVHAETVGYTQFTASAGTNYLVPDAGAATDVVSIGGLSSPSSYDLIPGRVSTHLPSITDGFSLRLDTTSTPVPAHEIKMLTYRLKPSSDKNAAPRNF